jgi:hypothetical protein
MDGLLLVSRLMVFIHLKKKKKFCLFRKNKESILVFNNLILMIFVFKLITLFISFANI